MSSLPRANVYENFMFTQKYAFAEGCCFLTFSFEGKFRKYDISVKRKHTKADEKMIFSVLFTNFSKRKILFSCSAFYVFLWCFLFFSWFNLFVFSEKLLSISENMQKLTYKRTIHSEVWTVNEMLRITVYFSK